MNTFSIKEALIFAWGVFKTNVVYLISVSVILGVVSGGLSFVSGLLSELGFGITSAIVTIISMVLAVIIGIGLIYISLKLYDKEEPTYRDLVSQTQHFVRYLITSILYGAIVVVGLIFFIIPGIFFGIKFSMYRYFIVDKNMGIIESLKGSARLTKGSMWKLLALFALLGIMNFVGIMLLFVGLLVTIPITMLTLVYVYRTLLSKTAGVQEIEKETDSVANSKVAESEQNTPDVSTPSVTGI